MIDSQRVEAEEEVSLRSVIKDRLKHCSDYSLTVTLCIHAQLGFFSLRVLSVSFSWGILLAAGRSVFV